MRRRANDHTVEVLGEALELHHCLAAAIRARAEIRVPDAIAVKCADDLFRARGLKVMCAPAEVDDLFRVPWRKVGGPADMPGIRGAACVAAPQGVGYAGIVDHACEAALAGREKFVVPTG